MMVKSFKLQEYDIVKVMCVLLKSPKIPSILQIDRYNTQESVPSTRMFYSHYHFLFSVDHQIWRQKNLVWHYNKTISHQYKYTNLLINFNETGTRQQKWHQVQTRPCLMCFSFFYEKIKLNNHWKETKYFYIKIDPKCLLKYWNVVVP